MDFKKFFKVENDFVCCYLIYLKIFTPRVHFMNELLIEGSPNSVRNFVLFIPAFWVKSSNEKNVPHLVIIIFVINCLPIAPFRA